MSPTSLAVAWCNPIGSALAKQLRSMPGVRRPYSRNDKLQTIAGRNRGCATKHLVSPSRFLPARSRLADLALLILSPDGKLKPGCPLKPLLLYRGGHSRAGTSGPRLGFIPVNGLRPLPRILPFCSLRDVLRFRSHDRSRLLTTSRPISLPDGFNVPWARFAPSMEPTAAARRGFRRLLFTLVR